MRDPSLDAGHDLRHVGRASESGEGRCLLPSPDFGQAVRAVGGSRVPSLEVLVNTGRVAERIADSMRTHEINDVLADGAYYGMRTFDQSLLELVAKGRVTVEDAMEASSVPHDFELALKQAQLLPQSA